ncbi:AraC family transcriptional regulator [Sphingobacterium corticibacterium]|uniref:AraC family transcriptional regulator n=1 Tax=Sphingobacterium corticibacterium TaxID=2484746 RepID=A0A4Q6XK25_9SPHI|nr:AraC family transcriptional regulator [Sphingobacterium corticibacterium]RZF60203.1 AraC family transcriptional regulator [Sphingobacterium corticibacterium]
MKAKFHQVPKAFNNAFSIRHDILPHFGTIWHYHPEIELHYLIKGEGVRFIGDHIDHFGEDDMVLLGSNLPHTWKCNEIKQGENHVEALVLHFHPECLGKEFLTVSETQEILKLLQLSKNGLIIHGDTKERIKELMAAMQHTNGLEKLIYLFAIFRVLATSDEYETLSRSFAYNKLNKIDESRMDKVFSHTLTNFREKISIEDVAILCNLSSTSFCRYFKMITNKSYFDFLTEVRLNHACRLIIDSDLTMQHIAVESGFENTSNFYRHFKKFKGITPTEYRKRLV